MDGAIGATARWLVVAEEAFVPTDSGGRVESLNFLRAAQEAGIGLHVVVPGPGPAGERGHRAVLPEADVTGIPRSTGWRSHLSATPYVFVSRPIDPRLAGRMRSLHEERPFDAVVGLTFRVAHIAEVLAVSLRLPLVIRPHNLESDYFAQLARSSRFPMSVPYRIESSKLRRAEARIHRSRVVTVFADIASADADRRRNRTAAPVLHVPPFVPHSAPTGPEPSGGTGSRPGRRVLFVGSLDNGNNVDGARWFLRSCWPAVLTRAPRATVRVVGRRAPSELRAELEGLGAEVVTDAPEVGPYFAEADVFVNPVRAGSGVNIKVVEAVAAGVPVVTTTVGARGLRWRHGRELMMADDPQPFADSVADLLDDPERRAALAGGGLRFVRDELDGAGHVRRLLAALGGVGAGRTHRPSAG